MAVNQQLIGIRGRHQIYLSRVAASEFNRISKNLDELLEGLLRRIPDNMTDYSRRKLEAHIKTVEAFQEAFYSKNIKSLRESFDELADAEIDFEVKSIKTAVISGVTIHRPSFNQVLAAIKSNPLSIGANGAGKLLEPFIDDWKKTQKETVNGILRMGWSEGQTVRQMAQGVRQSVSGQTKRTAEAVVRTSINHVSQVSAAQVWEENEDIVEGWRFIAVLDDRTTRECNSIASLDRVYPVGKGPYPPRHINCRSGSIPELKDEFEKGLAGTRASKGASGGGQVRASMTNYEFLKTQPREFVEDAIGVKMAGALFSGKLSTKEFARFTLNARLEPLTIKEMIAKDKRLNLGLFD